MSGSLTVSLRAHWTLTWLPGGQIRPQTSWRNLGENKEAERNPQELKELPYRRVLGKLRKVFAFYLSSF